MHFMTDSRLKKLAKMIVEEVINQTAGNKCSVTDEIKIKKAYEIYTCKEFCECRRDISGENYCANCDSRYNMVRDENIYQRACKVRCYITFNYIKNIFICSNCLVHYKRLDQAL